MHNDAPLMVSPRISASPGMAAQQPMSLLDEDGIALVWSNEPPPAGSTDNVAGAHNVYDRSTASAALGNGRKSPFELKLTVLNADGESITARPDVCEYLKKLFDTIWGWKSTEWADALAGVPSLNANEILTTKANAFWEHQSQWAAERVFGPSARASEAVYLFGPKDVDPAGRVLASHDDEGIADAVELRTTTHIDGARDPLMSIGRTIVYVARRAELPIASASRVNYRIHVPAGVAIASTHREFLDWRPSIGGVRLAEPVTIHACNPSGAPDRYPDFGRLSVPLRHLLLQGEVGTPKTAKDAPCDYESEDALNSAFVALVEEMCGPPRAYRRTHALTCAPARITGARAT